MKTYETRFQEWIDKYQNKEKELIDEQESNFTKITFGVSEEGKPNE